MSLFGLNEEILALRDRAQADIAPMFARIDEVAEHNTQKVLAAFQKHKVAEYMFAGTTGYGYGDTGRDTLEKIWHGQACHHLCPVRQSPPRRHIVLCDRGAV